MSAPAVIHRVKRNLVGLKMPRALEILDVTVRGIERGEITAIEAIDTLLTEELTLRENRRVKMALQMAKLSAIKTLTGFDFRLPALARQEPRHGARAIAVHRSRRGRPPDRSARHRQDPSQPGARRRGGESRPQRLLQLPR